jgi:hypothetical protein
MTPLLFFGLFILFSVVMIACYYCTAKFHERIIKRYNEYERKYKIIEFRINYDPQTPDNYSSIERMLACLGKLPYKNREKTYFLIEHFWTVWRDERSYRVNNYLKDVLKDEYTES